MEYVLNTRADTADSSVGGHYSPHRERQRKTNLLFEPDAALDIYIQLLSNQDHAESVEWVWHESLELCSGIPFRAHVEQLLSALGSLSKLL